MPHWLEKVIEILQAPTADLRKLAHLAGGDPRTFYRGVTLSDLDSAGQNIEGMEFSAERVKKRIRRKRRVETESRLIRVLRRLNVKKMSAAEKVDLTKKLREHSKELKTTMKVVDQHLKKLRKKKKRKVGSKNQRLRRAKRSKR